MAECSVRVGCAAVHYYDQPGKVAICGLKSAAATFNTIKVSAAYQRKFRAYNKLPGVPGRCDPITSTTTTITTTTTTTATTTTTPTTTTTTKTTTTTTTATTTTTTTGTCRGQPDPAQCDEYAAAAAAVCPVLSILMGAQLTPLREGCPVTCDSCPTPTTTTATTYGGRLCSGVRDPVACENFALAEPADVCGTALKLDVKIGGTLTPVVDGCPAFCGTCKPAECTPRFSAPLVGFVVGKTLSLVTVNEVASCSLLCGKAEGCAAFHFDPVTGDCALKAIAATSASLRADSSFFRRFQAYNRLPCTAGAATTPATATEKPPCKPTFTQGVTGFIKAPNDSITYPDASTLAECSDGCLKTAGCVAFHFSAQISSKACGLKTTKISSSNLFSNTAYRRKFTAYDKVSC